MFTFRELALPVVAAPMAGGPSTPELVAAVSSVGGFGFLAAGYLTAAQLAADIARTRTLTDAPFGVNLFVPQASVAKIAELEAYRLELLPEAARYGVELPALAHAETAPTEQSAANAQSATTGVDDDDWDAKLAVLEASGPAVVSFTFGLPPIAVVARLHTAGIVVVATVTSVAEAAQAINVGVDVLCAQGPGAGGHRGTFDPAATLATQPLERLLDSLVALTDLPIIAAGGLSSSADVHRVLSHGAVAAQAGTAFLQSPEAGTKAAHRAALDSAEFVDTAVTRAFSGRAARGLVNRFLQAHAAAPLGYPEVNRLTAPLRAAAAAAGDPHGMALWAGTGHRLVRARPAAEITRMLAR
ncbi:nitronate monooxygenase [Cryobacterium frigoriphilum]|uniref:Propionate 3-nitronate monooxygenase n=1 Tax=Cryobacterium frigoriphilum TaxID=1259150 RepID=A0A4R8ZVJ5_9MICO|nr:nitronate monooxygenase [Cryobacterium frigoriphilum]TFD47200.1 nitronate monooxygenase [Cryobacterium frigoriphilum]